MQAKVRTTESLRSALFELGVADGEPADGLIFEVVPPGDAWEAVLAELRAAFRLSREAAQNGAPVVYVVHGDDLLGRRGPGNAMAATGVLSAARTLAFEGRKSETPANVVALEDGTDPVIAARWVTAAMQGGPTGELIRMGGSHIGKALP